MRGEKYFIVGLILLCNSCATILQNNAIKNFKDPVTKTDTYKALNSPQQDFYYLKTVCDNYFPRANSYFTRHERTKIETEILRQLGNGNVTDLEFQLYLKKYLSHFDNQHTHITFKDVQLSGLYPFIAYNQDSSWYVLNTTKDYNRNLLGKKIVAFNNHRIDDYEKELFQFVSAENQTTKRKQIFYWWYRPTIHEFIADKKADSISLTLEDKSTVWIKKVRTVKSDQWILKEQDFVGHPITRYKLRMYDYQIIDSLKLTYFQFHNCYDKIEIKEGMKTYIRPWLRPLANLYVNIQTSKKRPSKRLKQYFDPERPIFHNYVRQMVEESIKKDVPGLIIDLRNNNGGSEMLCLQLLYYLTDRQDLKDFQVYVQNSDFYSHYSKKEYTEQIEYYKSQNGVNPPKDSLFFAGANNSTKALFDNITNPESPYYIPKERPVFKGKIVIIADFSTQSAGSLFTTLLQDNNIGLVIGTETGNNPTGPTSYTPFKLPNSKINTSIPCRYLVRPDSKKSDKFKPDIWMEKSITDIFKGMDPLFDKAIEILNSDQAASR